MSVEILNNLSNLVKKNKFLIMSSKKIQIMDPLLSVSERTYSEEDM